MKQEDMSVAYLISHPDDFTWIKKTFRITPSIISHNDHLPILIDCARSFYEITNDEIEVDSAIEYLTFNWHRDENGVDLLRKSEISIAEAFSCGVWINIAGLCREYFAISYWLKKYERIYISCNESEEFKKIALSFGSRILIYDPLHKNRPDLPSLNSRPLQKRPIAWYYRVLRAAQTPFLSLFFDKTLAIQDWTLQKHSRKQVGWLSINSRRFWKAAYLRNPSRKRLQLAEEYVPKNYDAYLSPRSLLLTLERFGVEWDLALMQLISQAMRQRYIALRDYFVWTIALYEDILNSYRPVELVVTTEMFEPYSIASQLAKKKGIKTSCLVDGYPVISYSRRIGHKRIGPDFFDRIYAVGPQHAVNLKKSSPVSQEIVTIFPPILIGQSKSTKISKKYDVIIMTLIPTDITNQGRSGSRIKNLIDMLGVAKEAGFKKLAIKIKHSSEVDLIITTLKNFNLMGSDVDILSGNLSQYIESADCIIGGISSAIGEAAFHGVPYFIYEPISNGYTLEQLNSSVIFKRQDVARSRQELLHMLSNSKGSINCDPKFLFGGVISE